MSCNNLTRVPGWCPLQWPPGGILHCHFNDVIMSVMAALFTGLSVIYSIVFCSAVDQRKHQSSSLLAFVRGIHRWPVNSPHKGPVNRKMFPFDDFIILMPICLPPFAHTWTSESFCLTSMKGTPYSCFNTFVTFTLWTKVRYIEQSSTLTLLIEVRWYKAKIREYDMMWCDVMWYGVIWYDMIWYEMRWDEMRCDVMWCDVIWYDMIWYDMIWYDMIWYEMTDEMRWDEMWCDVMWCDVIWYDMIWYDMIWYDMIWYEIRIR